MSVFHSRADQKLDSKGRVSVPALFRSVLGGAREDGLMLSQPLLGTRCIEVAPAAMLQKRYEEVARLNRHNPIGAQLRHVRLSSIAMVGFDKEGRIVLPSHLIAYAGLEALVTFVGLGDVFQIWDPKALATYDEEAWAVAQEHQELLHVPLTEPAG